MGKLDERGIMLVILVPIAASIYLLVTLTPYLTFRDTWERDNRGRILALAKKLDAKDEKVSLAAAKEILDVVANHELTDPKLLQAMDTAKVLVSAQQGTTVPREPESAKTPVDQSEPAEARPAKTIVAEPQSAPKPIDDVKVEPPSSGDPDLKAASDTVEAWLQAQKVGEPARGYWDPESKLLYQEFYAVQKWEILKAEFVVRDGKKNPEKNLPAHACMVLQQSGHAHRHRLRILDK
ncbi:MAG: hypothetical protein M5U26_30375 [Planctomycetota bacterium]|nr:hypothetical protein [Planctomycetota bacterium]